MSSHQSLNDPAAYLPTAVTAKEAFLVLLLHQKKKKKKEAAFLATNVAITPNIKSVGPQKYQPNMRKINVAVLTSIVIFIK